jgi:hypothetical protein
MPNALMGYEIIELHIQAAGGPHPCMFNCSDKGIGVNDPKGVDTRTLEKAFAGRRRRAEGREIGSIRGHSAPNVWLRCPKIDCQNRHHSKAEGDLPVKSWGAKLPTVRVNIKGCCSRHEQAAKQTGNVLALGRLPELSS